MRKHSSIPAFVATHEATELVAKRSRTRNLWVFIFQTIFLGCILGTSYVKYGTLFGETYYTVLAVFAASSMVFNFFSYTDRRIHLGINSNGVWHSAKGLFEWSNFSYYFVYRIERKSDLRIRLHDREEQLIIDLDWYDKDKDRILTAFTHYAAQYSIKDARKETVSVT